LKDLASLDYLKIIVNIVRDGKAVVRALRASNQRIVSQKSSVELLGIHQIKPPDSSMFPQIARRRVYQ